MINTARTVMKAAHYKFKALKSQFNLLKGDLCQLWSSCLKWAWRTIKAFNTKLDLWINGVEELITVGIIRLNCGDVVYCGGTMAYYVNHNDSFINLAHWQGSEQATKKLFNIKKQAQGIR